MMEASKASVLVVCILTSVLRKAKQSNRLMAGVVVGFMIEVLPFRWLCMVSLSLALFPTGV